MKRVAWEKLVSDRFGAMGKILALVVLTACAEAQPKPIGDLPKLIQTIDLPGVQGRLDHLDLDPVGQRLFLGALENDSLEVIDLVKGQVLKHLGGLGGPQGVAFLPGTNEVLIAGRDTGNLVVLSATTWEEKRRLVFGIEADNLHYLPAAGVVLLGFGNGAVAFIDAKTDQIVGTVPLGGHPEGLQGQAATGRVLVNVPTTGALFAVDLTTHQILAKWSPTGLFSNYPLAVQETRHRGAYYSHFPSQVTLFDTITGATLAQKDAPGDIDDLFFDDLTDRLYLVSGAGRLEFWSVPASGQPTSLGSVETAAGARTGFYNGALHRLYVAAPARNGRVAQILVFQTP